MTNKPQSVPQDLWNQVELEKQKDKRVKRVSTVAWAVTGLAILFYGSIVFKQFLHYQRMVESGMMPSGSEWAVLTPLVGVVGLVALFVAILATVGMFFRLRTSSLEELKVRLTSLEDLVLDHVDSAKP
jgi:uncharacterized membrane protein